MVSMRAKATPSASAESDTPDVVDSICHTITSAILDRSLRPGARLTEDVIGDHFGVSRTVVRSALNRLQRDRLVSFRKNRGAFVAEPTIEEALNVLHTRYVIERAILDRVVDNLGEPDIAALRAHVAEEERSHSRMAKEDIIVFAGQFHMLLAKIARNDVLEGFLEQLIQRSSLVISLYGRSVSDSCGAHDHAGLVEALARRDREAAQEILQAHLKEIEAGLRLESEGDMDLSLKDVLLSHGGSRRD